MTTFQIFLDQTLPADWASLHDERADRVELANAHGRRINVTYTPETTDAEREAVVKQLVVELADVCPAAA